MSPAAPASRRSTDCAIDDDADDRRIALVALVAHELDAAADALRDLIEGAAERGPRVVLHCRARALALGVHLDVEGILVDLKPRLGGDLRGEFVREAVGVVQRERHAAVEDGCRSAPRAVDRRLEERQTLPQRRAEALLLAERRCRRTRSVMLDDLGIRLAHALDDVVDERA